MTSSCPMMIFRSSRDDLLRGRRSSGRPARCRPANRRSTTSADSVMGSSLTCDVAHGGSQVPITSFRGCESRASSARSPSPASRARWCTSPGPCCPSAAAALRRAARDRAAPDTSARSFGIRRQRPSSPAEPSDSDRRHLAVLAGRRRIRDCPPCRRCRRAARARWRAALRARRRVATSAFANWNASSTLTRLFLSASAASESARR